MLELLQITDPELGGGTAFAQAGVHVTSKSGSAVLWYNTFSSGDADKEVHHGGCPVIFGEKRSKNYIFCLVCTSFSLFHLIFDISEQLRPNFLFTRTKLICSVTWILQGGFKCRSMANQSLVMHRRSQAS